MKQQDALNAKMKGSVLLPQRDQQKQLNAKMNQLRLEATQLRSETANRG
jgi:hypothetical protein